MVRTALRRQYLDGQVGSHSTARQGVTMNDDVDPSTPHASTDPTAGEPPRRRPAVTILTTAPAVALTALAALPLTVAVRITTDFGASHTAMILSDDCSVSFATTAMNGMKWPLCGGD
jgi:hypothetical protein